MPIVSRIPVLAAALVLGAASLMPVHAEPAQAASAQFQSRPQLHNQSEPAPAALADGKQERVRIGLSDPDTRLILPWFLTEVTTAVNEGKSVKETAQGLAQGL